MPTGSQCQNCRHYFGALRCEAYIEKQIPQPFLSGLEDHGREKKGQVPGFYFEYLAPGSPSPLEVSR